MNLFGGNSKKKKQPAAEEKPLKKRKPKKSIPVDHDHPLHDFLRSEIKCMDGQPNWDYYYRQDVPALYGANKSRLQTNEKFLDRCLALRKLRSNLFLTHGDQAAESYSLSARKESHALIDKAISVLEQHGMTVTGHLHIYSKLNKSDLRTITEQAEKCQSDITAAKEKTVAKRKATKAENQKSDKLVRDESKKGKHASPAVGKKKPPFKLF